MDGTILSQGTFAASNPVANQTVVVPSNADWMKVYNYTQAGTAAGGNYGFEYYWQRGMAAGTGMVKYTTVAGYPLVNIDTLVSGGFTLYNPSGTDPLAQPILGPAIATTATTNVTRPVVSTANTAGLAVGSVVRLSNTAQTDINGIDFAIGAVVAGVSFTLTGNATAALANAPGAIGGAGFWRAVNTDYLYYPRKRWITNISQAANAVVSTTVQHGLTPGQAIRFNIPAVSGMTQLNPTAQNNYLYATVVSVTNDFTFVVDTNTTGFTAFTYPTIAQQPSSFPTLEPIGENTANALVNVNPQTPTIGGVQIYNTNTGILADSTVNTGFLGMILGTGGNGNALGAAITGPAGSVAADVMYWVAGKSTLGGL
jgi:hypothetical protein